MKIFRGYNRIDDCFNYKEYAINIWKVFCNSVVHNCNAQKCKTGNSKENIGRLIQVIFFISVYKYNESRQHVTQLFFFFFVTF